MHFSQTSPTTIRKAANDARIWLLHPWEYISLKLLSESNLIQPAACLTTPNTPLCIIFIFDSPLHTQKMWLLSWNHKNARTHSGRRSSPSLAVYCADTLTYYAWPLTLRLTFIRFQFLIDELSAVNKSEDCFECEHGWCK